MAVNLVLHNKMEFVVVQEKKMDKDDDGQNQQKQEKSIFQQDQEMLSALNSINSSVNDGLNNPEGGEAFQKSRLLWDRL